MDHRASDVSRLGHERRRHARSAVLLRVDYRDHKGLMADYVTDIGDGGLFIQTSVPFEIGQTVSLALSFPGLLEETQVYCIVRWVARGTGPDGTRQQTGVGVEFAHESKEQETKLKRFLSSLARESEHTERARGALKVLLVDDNNFVSELFRHAIKRFERIAHPGVAASVLYASSATEAMRMLGEGEHPDLMVVDHYMPGMPGVELVKRIRSDDRFRETPILMVSVGGKEVKEAALSAGATLFVDKPVLLTQLIDTMRVLLAQKEG